MRALRDTDERLYRRGSGYRGRLGGKSAWHSDAVGAESGADGSEGAEGGAALEGDGLDAAIGDALDVADIDHLQAVGRLAHDLDPDKYPYTHLTDLTAANYVAGNPLYDVLHDGRTVFDGPPLLSLKSLGGLRTVDGTAVTEWNVDMPALTTTAGGYSGMFTPLTRFTGALPNLQEGRVMFYTSGITSWDVELPSLTSASWMFRNMPNLVEWSGSLNALTNGDTMFGGSGKLQSFETDSLSRLTNGGLMFYSNQLTSFRWALPSLTNGDNMFTHCKLDLPSVRTIARTIKDNSSMAAHPPLTLGMAKALQGKVEAELNLIRSKGWALTAQYN